MPVPISSTKECYEYDDKSQKEASMVHAGSIYDETALLGGFVFNNFCTFYFLAAIMSFATFVGTTS
jgi:hypothetical protein